MSVTSNFTLNDDGTLKTFDYIEVGKYGVYVIRRNKEVLRVGESSSGLGRIIKGFKEPLRKMSRGKIRKNYMAYHWRVDYPKAQLEVDYFNLSATDFSDNHLRRALEAEITFQFRISNRAWPREMSEIHFLERFRQHTIITSVTTAVLKNYGLVFSSNI